MPEYNYETLLIADLVPYEGNARVHSDKQIRQIARSMKEYGVMSPILVDEDNLILAGHGRVRAAEMIGLLEVPAVRHAHLTEAQKRGYILLDNKIAENAAWDKELLRVELEFLLQEEVNFDVDLTGFSTPEMDFILGGDQAQLKEVPIPALPDPKSVVSRQGDIWQLGKHRLACGDARDKILATSLLDGEQARMAVTDPPFNVPISGHVCGKDKHPDFAMAIGEMTPDEFTRFLVDSVGNMVLGCMNSSLVYVFMDWRHLQELQNAFDEIDLKTFNLCVWAKSNAGMGSLYRSQHELVLIGKHGKAPHINNVELGKHGRYRSNLWQYAGQNAFGAERDEALAMHPTVKPVAMIADAIMDVSHKGEIVLDYFLGSGTTLMAAEQTHRRCYGLEFDPRYVDLAIKRWVDRTGGIPVHLASGQSYGQLAEQREISPVTA